MSDNLPVTALVTRARNGEKQAWDALIERSAPLIWSICRRYRLGGSDADRVGQAVWLQLAGHLDNVRDPAALVDWLASTARRECGRMLRAAKGTAGCQVRPGRRDHPGRADQDGGAGTAGGRAARCAA